LEAIIYPVAETTACSLNQTNQLINSISGRSCVSVLKIAFFRRELTDVLLLIGTNFILMKSSPIKKTSDRSGEKNTLSTFEN